MSGVALLLFQYSETDTFEPLAATHGYTEVPLPTIVRGALQVAPQSPELLKWTLELLPATSNHVA